MPLNLQLNRLDCKRKIGASTPPFNVNDIAYSDGTLAGGSNNWIKPWQVDGVLPKAWSDGTAAGGSSSGGWTWQSDWILS